jgi:co-chaperonin GroES (HSP10)
MTNIKVGDKVIFTTSLDINDFSISKREYLLGNMNTIFTVKKVHNTVDSEIEIYLDDVSLDDCYFKENEVELIALELPTLTPIEYNKQFDEIIFKSLLDICQLKGVELKSSSELIQDIRYSIIGRMANYHMNVSPPQYKVGDTIYVDGKECKIIFLGNESYGVLNVTDYSVIGSGYGVDLQTFIGDLDNEGRLVGGE